MLTKTLEVFQRQYLRTGAQKNSSLWALCQLGSGVTQEGMCKYVWVKHNECKICGELGTEKHRLHHCKWSKKNLRLQRSAEVRAFEDIARVITNVGCGKNGNCVFPWTMQTESVVDFEKATCSQVHWMSEDSEEWNTYFRERAEAG